jgi:hypothetical protein
MPGLWMPTLLLLYIAGVVFISRWIYLDARYRSMNIWIWVTITLFISPNFIGLLLYLFVRRKEPVIRCSQCYAEITQNAVYCSQCGSKVTLLNDTKVSEPSHNSLIVGIVCMVSAVMISLLATTFYFLPGSSAAVNKSNNYWREEFYSIEKTDSDTFIAGSDLARLEYSVNIEKGKIRFEIYNANDSLINVIPQNHTELTKKTGLSEYNKSDNGWFNGRFGESSGGNGSIGGFTKGEIHTVKVIRKKATGKFTIEMKDN